MAELPQQAPAEYARDAATAASPSRVRILVWGGLLLAILVAGFVSLGLWQWNKYAVKTALQTIDQGAALSGRSSLPDS